MRGGQLKKINIVENLGGNDEQGVLRAALLQRLRHVRPVDVAYEMHLQRLSLARRDAREVMQRFRHHQWALQTEKTESVIRATFYVFVYGYLTNRRECENKYIDVHISLSSK